MRKSLYALEDHFCAVSEERGGTVSGWLSGRVGKMFGLLGDILQAGLDARRS
jgi:hypothetical protein